MNMYCNYIIIFLLLSVLSLLCHHCHSATVLVDGVSEWKNPSVHVGDSIIFKHKYRYKLYIFQNQNAFKLCNLTQATLLTKPNFTSYTWNPSRPGFFYFTFNNGSLKSCQDNQMLSIKVSPAAPPPTAGSPPATDTSTAAPEIPPMAAPAPISGGIVGSSPAYQWPSQPHQVAVSPSLPPIAATAPVNAVPTLVPDKGGSIPFINSNPAVPLPTGEVDSATIKPLPTSGHGKQVMVGFVATQITLFNLIFLLL